MIIQNKNRKLEYISSDDDIAFKYNNDVLYACFNTKYESDYGQYASYLTGDDCLAWFPKERVLKNGVWVSGSSEVNWKNYIDGDVIVSYLSDGENEKKNNQPEMIRDFCPMYTFFNHLRMNCLDSRAYMFQI